jgi:hypothetical protein
VPAAAQEDFPLQVASRVRQFKHEQLFCKQAAQHALYALGALRARIVALRRVVCASALSLGALSAEFQMARQAQQPDAEEQATQIRSQVEATLASEREQYAQTEVGALLTPADWQRLEAAVHERPQLYVRRAGAQPSAEEQAKGIQPGELYWDGRAYERDIQLIAQVRREARANESKHKEALEAVKRAAEENARRAQAPKVNAPQQKKPAAARRPAPVQDDEDDVDEVLDRAFSGLV